jgi:adenylate cyclase
MKQTFWKRLFTGAVMGLITGIVVWILTQMLFNHFFFRIESQTYDWRLRLATEPPANPIDDIVIIDIDERSIQKLGSYHYWTREYWSKLIGYLDSAGVAMIGLDVIFDPNPRHPEEDAQLQQAISKAGNVCLTFYFSMADEKSFRPAMVNEPENLNYQRFIYEVPDELSLKLMAQDRFEPSYPGFLNASNTAGFVSLFADPDGIIRRIPLLVRFNQHVYPAFPFQMFLELQKITSIDYLENESQLILTTENQQKLSIPIDSHGQMLIRYAGAFNSFRYISFYDVLSGNMDANYFKDKVILVGSSLAGFYDLRSTPLQPAFPGVEINANVIYQLLNSQFIYQMGTFSKFLLVILLAVISGAILIFLRPLGSVIYTVGFIFLVLLAGVYALQYSSFWLPIVPLLLLVIIAFSINYVYRYMFEEKDKRQTRKTFAHYVAPSVVEIMLENPDMVKLGGEKKFCTVLFSDLVSFTSLAETMEPTKLVHLLNDYMTSMTEVIFKYKGTLDKYEGDAILAIFGAPVEIPESPELACYTALEMQKQLQVLVEYWKKINRPPLQMRIGINSGDMIVGNMGSITRFDYTVVGDSVNLASRLEGANKLYGTRIIIGEQTFAKVHEKFITRPLDLLRVKGKKTPVQVYDLISRKEDKLPDGYKEMILEYQLGFKEYLQRHWNEAIQHFQNALQQLADDGPSKLYLERCREFSQRPPDETWDGVYVMHTK